MWKEKLLTLLYSLDRRQLLSVALLLLGIVILSGGVFYSLSSSKQEEQIAFEPSTENAQAQNTETGINVDIEGAVINPGVYNLKASSRIKDGLIASGGLGPSADRAWIAKNLNLALKLSDSSKIYIPKTGELATAPLTSSDSVVSSTGLININSASSSQLDSLPGIGPVTAQKIIDNRPYGSIDDLKSKKIVGQSVFDKIKDKISTY